MGREIKRVPLDFDWPRNKVWLGYMIDLCAANDEDCDQCRLFAKILGLETKDGDCPDFAFLDPPKGEGYQFWENVSEGSPRSPVFATPEELARWLTDNEASALGNNGTLPYEKWLIWIVNSGYAPSMIMDASGLHSGVEAFANDYLAKKETD